MKTVSDMLSQEEIDALLNQSEKSNEKQADGSVDDKTAIDEYLSTIEQDALGEIGNISFGSSSTALSVLLNQKVDITTPHLKIIQTDKLKEEFPKPHIAIHVKYTEGFKGLNLLVIQMNDAKVIADLMLGGDGTSPDEELNDMHLSAVQEAMNQMMGSAATSMSTMFNERIDISPPGVDIFDVTSESSNMPLIDEDVLLKVSFRMKIGQLVDSHIMQLIPVPFAKEMVQKLLNPDAEQVQQSDSPTVEGEHDQPTASQASMSKGAKNEDMSAIPENKEWNQPKHVGPIQGTAQNRHAETSQVHRNDPQVQNVQFPNFDQKPSDALETKNLDLLMDIPLQVTVELGRTKRVIKDILELSPGSIIELDKLAGEPVDILINNKPIAKGEVVVIEENFGVRVTDILSQWDRLQKLQ